MFSDVSEVQEFLVWCKHQGVQTVEVGGVKVAFAPLAVAQVIANQRPAPPKRPDEKKTEDDIDPATGYHKEDLFASSE